MLSKANTNQLFSYPQWFSVLLLIAMMLLHSSLASAAIYQCKNALGKIAFQDHPCAEAGINDNRYQDKTGTITKDDKKHFLWKATRDRDSIYLLGSIHVGRPDMYPLSVSVMDAFNKSEVLMVEVNTEAADQLELARQINNVGMYPEGTTLEKQIPLEIWDKLVATAKALNVPELLLQRQKPWLVSLTLATSMMSKSGYQTDYGIDKHFLKQATAANKEIVELESITSQMELFSNLSDQEQLSLLTNSLEEMQQGSLLLDKLVTAWIKGDYQTIEKVSRESMGIDSKNSRLYKALIVNRNHSMANKIIQAAQDHRKYYVVVGAAHLVGEQGIPEILSSRGFSIEEF